MELASGLPSSHRLIWRLYTSPYIVLAAELDQNLNGDNWWIQFTSLVRG